MCVNPGVARGLLDNPLPPPPHVFPTNNMDTFGKISLIKFNGYPIEDAERFLSNFLAYSVLKLIENNDCRKVAAFQLHLDGPAKSWFYCLEDKTQEQLGMLKCGIKGQIS